MGLYLNPGGEGFEIALNSRIYVDKSMLIDFTNSVFNTEERFMCVSRPRRFGKTIAGFMLMAYYEHDVDGDSLFRNLKISKTESYSKHLNKYDVLHITMTEFIQRNGSSMEEMLQEMVNGLIYDVKEEYPDISFRETNKLSVIMRQIYAKTKRRFVIIIDEWDCVFRFFPDNKEFQNVYLNFLRDWLKNQNFVGLAYMTGILPIKKYGEHSALNMFYEYSMLDAAELCEFTGITDDEVQELCSQHDVDYDDIKAWYDGYILQPRNEGRVTRPIKRYEVYNPLSVVRAIASGNITNYWNRTETYEALKKYIVLNMDGLKDTIIQLIAGGRKVISPYKFVNDMTTFNSVDDVLTLMVHLGYLAFDNATREVFIPNFEIRDEFLNCIDDEKDWSVIVNAIKRSENLLTATINKDSDSVAEALENAHFETSILQYNDENALSYVIGLAYYSSRRKYNITREMPAGKGFADMVFTPKPNFPELPAMIVELKWDKSANTAIQQIKDNKYVEGLKDYKGRVLLVGVNYDKKADGEKYKKHTCVIEEVENYL